MKTEQKAKRAAVEKVDHYGSMTTRIYDTNKNKTESKMGSC